jgi:hypothetical protein
MDNRLTRRRKLYVMVFIVIVLAAVWLLVQPRSTTAQMLDASAIVAWIVS